MSTHPRVVLVWSLVALTVLLFIGIFVFAAFDPREATEGAEEYLIIVPYTIFILSFATVGGLITTRHPRNPIGWICLGSGLAYALAGFGDQYVGYSTGVAPHLLPGTNWLLWTQALWVTGIAAVGCFLLLLFPTGSSLTSGWRPVLWLAAAGTASVVASVVLAPAPQDGYPGARNPFEPPLPTSVLESIGGAGLAALALAEVGAVASIIARFRRSSGHERQQLKWLMFSVVVVVATIAISVPLEIVGREEVSNVLVTIGLTSIPVAIGVAMLRHRLYNIDVVINRTLVYGSLTTFLAVAYFVLVVALQALVGAFDSGNNLAVAASTLAVAALFTPARRRIQGFIDRRFYRRKFDSERTLLAFSTRLRDEVDITTLSHDLLDVVEETMQPTQAWLWLRPTSGAAT